MTYDAMLGLTDKSTAMPGERSGRERLAARYRAFGDFRLERVAGSQGRLRTILGLPPRKQLNWPLTFHVDELELDQEQA